VLAQYVDLVDPLVTRKGRAAQDTDRLVVIISRRTGVSRQRARAFLRREAPRTEALLRAVPLSGIARERPRLSEFLATTLNVAPEDVQDEFARNFPKLFQALSELPSITGGWYDVPGIGGMTRLDGAPRVRSMPGVRDYLRDDLVPTVAEEKGRVGYVAGWGGIGYIPYLLLAFGVVLFAFGLLQARRGVQHPPDKIAWSAVATAGVFLLLVTAAWQYAPRLGDADTMVQRLAPAFEPERVVGLRAGTDLAVRAAAFGDGLMTADGAAAEYPELVTFVAQRSGLTRREVRSRLQRAAPRTTALFDAIPLSAVAEEQLQLLAVLSRKLGMSGSRLVRVLQKRTPAVAGVLLSVGPVTADWNDIRGTEQLERLDGAAPVRSVPEFVDYLARDLVPVFENERENFDRLGRGRPALGVLPWLVLGLGALVTLYAIAMMFVATRPPPRY
jgi:hypothetical protein